MAGFRDFQTGEVLTAANVNDFLMKQSILKFADSAARDTALGTAVGGSNALREGMVAYLDSTDEVLFYDGASWGAVGLPLGTATPTDGQILAFGTATSTWNPTDQLAGIGSNVVQAVKTDTFSTTSRTYQTVTGLSATITPSSDTSLVLVIYSLSVNGRDGTAFTQGRLMRGATPIYVGASSSSRSQDSFFTSGNASTTQAAAGMFLDSPGVDTAVTYSVELRSNTNAVAVYVNQSHTDTDADSFSRLASSITVIEVAA